MLQWRLGSLYTEHRYPHTPAPCSKLLALVRLCNSPTPLLLEPLRGRGNWVTFDGVGSAGLQRALGSTAGTAGDIIQDQVRSVCAALALRRWLALGRAKGMTFESNAAQSKLFCSCCKP